MEEVFVIEESVRKDRNKLRVNAKIIHCKDDRNVWTRSYDRNLDDVFGVQTDIAKMVTDALRVKILAPEIDRIEKKPTQSTKAYGLYLHGRFHLNKRGLEDINRAAEYFAQAVKEDAKFALGHAGLADCHELLATNWSVDTKTNHEKAKMEVATALELDSDLAEAHATLGLVSFDDYDFEGA